MTLVTGHARALKPGAQVVLRIFDNENNILTQRPAQNEIKYSFTVHTGGTHHVCVDNVNKDEITIEFAMNTGIQAKDYYDLARKSSLEPLELRLKKVEDSVQQIHK